MDIALTDFESNVRNLVSDTEKAYWELYFRYRSRDIAKKGQEVALKIWQWTNSLFPNIDDAAAEAQAREQYYLFRSTVEQASASLYESEAKLRYMMGLAATDGRLIRPIDEPTTAKVSFDWYEILSEALVRNVELRRIKFGVKNRELSLIASKNFLLPQLDVDALYRWRGMGNDLLSSGRQSGGFLAADSNAYQSLTSGQFQEWQIGLQFQMPIGFRRELSTVRNAELNLSKERAVLREAELELSHTLSTAWRSLEDDYQLSNSNFQRLNAAQKNFNAQIATKDLPKFQIENLLQAQRFLADAENNYYRSLVNYNVDIATVHYRKGSLLEYNGVYLAEGPWPGKAYFDARRRARARDAALYLDYGFTQPRVVSQGPYRQFAEKSPQSGGEPASALPENNTPQPEALPTPTPEPLDPGYNRKEAQPAPTVPQPPEPVAATAFPSATSGKLSKNSPLRAPTEGWSGEGQLSKNSPLLSGEGQGVRAGSAKPAGRKTFDISSLQLGKLEDNPIEQTSSLQPVNDRESAGKVPQKSSRLQWTDSKQKSTNESNANPSAAESDRPAPGWQGIQR
jgi:outer membrane protein TolC